jgi:outer membrane protein TolC
MLRAIIGSAQAIMFFLKPLIAIVLLLLLSSAPAAGEAEVYMISLAPNAALSLPQAVSAASERLRLQDWTAVRQQVAESRRELGAAWLGDTPSVGANWRDYEWFEDSKLYEGEIYLSLPLWLPGERKALSAAARDDAALVSLQRQARTLAAAAEVRQSYWQLRADRTRIELMQQLLAAAEHYVEQLTLRLQAGDIARGELLQSQQQVFDLRSRLLDAEARMIDSVRRWRLVTGLDTMPAEALEQQSAIGEITRQHPLLQLALAEVALLKSELAVNRNSGSIRPALSLSAKHELIDEQLPPLNSLGIGIDIPLGRGKANAVAVSRSQQRLLEAEVAMQNLQRKLEEDLHEVRHQTEVNASNLRDSQDLLDIAGDVYKMQQLAHKQGETSFVEVLRAGQQLARAQQRYALLSLTSQELIARYNQTVGVLPQ